MGVHGLWKLLEPAGKVVPLEGMAGKVLAVDVSIWLHQAMKGMHDSHGAPIAVAHLLILFHRLCKLLFYKIKPVFVFDGGVPALKRETMSVRRKTRNTAKNEAIKVRGKLLKNLLKHEAVRQMLSHAQPSTSFGLTSLNLPGSSVEEELFRLPPLAVEEDENSEEFSSEEGDVKLAEDIHTIDVRSSDFKNLPPEIRHEILIELIETRKQSSWKHLDKMPKELGNFSDFQMDRLLKRHAVQNSLDEASKEMGGQTMSMKDLEVLLFNEPDTFMNEERLPGKRIAQSEDIRYLLIQKSDNVEAFSEQKLESLTDDIKEELFEDEIQVVASTSTENAETNDVFDCNKEEELSQEAIYNLIKEENELSCPKTTKLSKNRKINLTDDVMEVLPMLGSDIEKLSTCDNLPSTDISNNEDGERNDGQINQPITSEKLSVETVKEEKFGPSKVNCDNDLPSKTKESTSVSTKVELVADKNSDLDFFPTMETKMQPTFGDTIASDEPQELEKSQPISRPEGDSEISDESEDDFVPVTTTDGSLLDNIISSNQNTATGTVEKDKSQAIEVVINVDKPRTETDDIFSDVFSDTVKENEVTNVEERDGKSSTFVEEADKAFTIPETVMTTEDLQNLQKSTAEEFNDLMMEQGKQERFAQNISEQMNLDAQELLRLFGVPYVVAPMEAEAQCAILNTIGLTDGTITDDSDIWLFGGKIVYKNFFNQKKHVLRYRSEDINRHFKLSREDLIKIALLVGSDYTSGLEGVGPVTALEILGEFPSSRGELLSGLKCFQKWFTNGEDISPSKGSLRRKMRNVKIASGFPSEAVVDAYLHPQVDDSKEPFSWAKPNVSLLQKYTQRKFGWSQEKCRELLAPVIKKLVENKNDTTIERYFLPVSRDSLPERALSKRVEKAVNNLRHQNSPTIPTEANESLPEKQNNPSTSKARNSKPASSKSNKEIIPQKRAMERLLEERKRSAISIFKRSKKRPAKRKPKIIVKDVNLSESSSSGSN